jgi:hypothetical protein
MPDENDRGEERRAPSEERGTKMHSALVEIVARNGTRTFSSRNSLVVIGATLLLGVFLAPVAQAAPADPEDNAVQQAGAQTTSNLPRASNLLKEGAAVAAATRTAEAASMPRASNLLKEGAAVAAESAANTEPAPSIPSSGFQYWSVVAYSVMAILLLAGAGTGIIVYRHQTHPVG